MLKASPAPLSRVRGVSEWVEQDLTLAMLANLATRGFRITS
jgi:hypothetical protein